MAEPMANGEGRYVYAVAPCRESTELGPIGIRGHYVYTIPYQDLCAIVHDCPAEAYQATDEEEVKEWVKAHNRVVEQGQDRWQTVIPLGFNTIVQTRDETTISTQEVKCWLQASYAELCELMKRIAGKDEYGVQIFYERLSLDQRIAEDNERIQEIQQALSAKSSGIAYMYQKKLEKAFSEERERYIDAWFQTFQERIVRHCDEVVLQGRSSKTQKDWVVLLNMSCLVARDRLEMLGNELEAIDATDHFSVRFTGPWSPYSFAVNFGREQQGEQGAR